MCVAGGTLCLQRQHGSWHHHNSYSPTLITRAGLANFSVASLDWTRTACYCSQGLKVRMAIYCYSLTRRKAAPIYPFLENMSKGSELLLRQVAPVPPRHPVSRMHACAEITPAMMNERTTTTTPPLVAWHIGMERADCGTTGPRHRPRCQHAEHRAHDCIKDSATFQHCLVCLHTD